MFRFARAFESSDELRMMLSDASVPAERRVAVVEDLLTRKALRVSVALAVFIVSAGRAGELPEIVDRFVEHCMRVRLDALTRRHGQLLPTWLM